jgi:hypothetical protein
MTPESDSNPESVEANQAQHAEGAPAGVACDFCGEVVDTVRRVALDGDYERLRTRHQAQYSCEDCFEKKERERLRASS